jgi:hypothetical protein
MEGEIQPKSSIAMRVQFPYLLTDLTKITPFVAPSASECTFTKKIPSMEEIRPTRYIDLLV